MGLKRPRGVLIDYGGTLVEEVSVDVRAGHEWLLAQVSDRPAGLTLERVLARADRVTTEVASRREHVHLETPWPSLTRLVHDYFGTRFDRPMHELEMGFWSAAVRTEPIPRARQALERLHLANLPIGVVSNSSFGAEVIRAELAGHGLTDRLAFVLVSAEYAVRKPNRMLFEVAAARLGVPPWDIWFMGDRLDTDVAGARAAGMTAVWFNRDGRPGPSNGADLTVVSWDAFVEHLLSAPVD